jgi:hypothetical protein
MDTAFRLTSPLGRAVAGGKSQFYNTLRSDPRYQSLLMHSHAQSVRRCHSQARTYVEVVRVTDAAGGECGVGLSTIGSAVCLQAGSQQRCFLILNICMPTPCMVCSVVWTHPHHTAHSRLLWPQSWTAPLLVDE